MRVYFIKDDLILLFIDKWFFIVFFEIVGVGGYEVFWIVLNISYVGFVEEDM